MKPITRHTALLGLLAVLFLYAACTGDPAPTASTSQPVAGLKPASLSSAAAAQPENASAAEPASSAERRVAQLATFKSRDYGISFQYPWQYARVSARAIARDASLRPMSYADGHFTLVRVEVPKGFYPDTNFERGYLTLSLNEDLGEEDCEVLVSAEAGKSRRENINGLDFLWTESESGGRGSSSVVRQYVAFANATCYHFELAATTRNEQGLVREAPVEHVLRRLDAMLRTVVIQPQALEPVAATARLEAQTEPSPEPQD